MLARCPSCAQSYNVPGEALGRRAKCRKCQYTFVVVIPEPEPSPEPAKVEEPPPRPQLQPKQPAPLTEWWDSRTAVQKLAALGFLGMLVILVAYSVIEGPSDVPPRNAPPAQPFPVAPPRPISKLTRENYLAVKDGMVEDEVILILGRPIERWAWPEKLRRGNVSLIYREPGKEAWINLETVGDNVPKVTSKRSSGL